jgi:hypothetical protein
MMPDERIVLQGEYYRPPSGGIEVYASRHKSPMRTALAEAGRRYAGSVAIELLKWAMNDSSYSDFEELTHNYPKAVIEFSAYSMCVGLLPFRNTLIWEVREY